MNAEITCGLTWRMFICWLEFWWIYIGVSCHSVTLNSFLSHLAPGALATTAKASMAQQICWKFWAKRRLWRRWTFAAATRSQQLRGSECRPAPGPSSSLRMPMASRRRSCSASVATGGRAGLMLKLPVFLAGLWGIGRWLRRNVGDKRRLRRRCLPWKIHHAPMSLEKPEWLCFFPGLPKHLDLFGALKACP